jgi:hypothetical protein
LFVQEVGALATPRYEAALAALADGRVLVAGGQTRDVGTDPLSSSELFDPATREFVPAGPMGVARFAASAVTLNDGTVLVAGGDTGYGQLTSDAEIFHPDTGRFSAAGSMHADRANAASILLPDGRVLVVGGGLGDDATSMEIFDPETGLFTPAGRFPDWRLEYSVAYLAGGHVLIVGGKDAEQHPLAGAELFDLASQEISQVRSMSTARFGASATVLSDGRVLVAGGAAGDVQLASVEMFDPLTNGFTPWGSLKTARSFAQAERVSDGRVVYVGGGPKVPIELFDASTKSTEAAVQFDGPSGPSAVVTAAGAVLILGGYRFSGLDGPSGASTAAFVCRP